MDHAPVANIAAVQATRAQQVEWIKSHGAGVQEVTTYWLRVGDQRLWAVRPVTSWEGIKELGKRLGALDEAITAKVGAAFEANEQKMHEALDEHHNELLRPIAGLTLAEEARKDAVTDLAQVATLRFVSIDKPVPAKSDEYFAAIAAMNQALRTAEPAMWRAVYSSGLGSGAYVHFVGADRPMSRSELAAVTERALIASLGEAEAKKLLAKLAASLAQHELVEASLDVERSTLP